MTFRNSKDLTLLALEDDDHCFACGKKNPCGLKLSFTYHNGSLFTEFVPSKAYQGYKNIIHGGIIATILDEAMIQAAIAEGLTPVTAEIKVRLKKPLSINEKTLIEAVITKKNKRLIEAYAKMLRKTDLSLIAEASAKLINIR